jgi:hypothetical protein
VTTSCAELSYCKFLPHFAVGKNVILRKMALDILKQNTETRNVKFLEPAAFSRPSASTVYAT